MQQVFERQQSKKLVEAIRSLISLFVSDGIFLSSLISSAQSYVPLQYEDCDEDSVLIVLHIQLQYKVGDVDGSY